MNQYKAVAILILLVALTTGVLADPCSPPASGNWNINDTSVLCDNGTIIVVDGNINLKNATLTVTNATLLNASSISEQTASTLFFNESSSTNASITFSFGNVTFENATLDGNLLLYQSGATARFTDSAIHGGISLSATGSGTVTTLILENGLYAPTQITVYKGLLNATNASIFTGVFSIGALVSPYSAATAVLTDTILSATSFTIGNMSALTTNNLTSNATLVLHENTTATLDRSTLNITASDATLTSSSWLVGTLRLNESTVATLTDVNGSITAENANLTLTGTANDTITAIRSTFILNGEARNVTAIASNLTVTGSAPFTLTNGSLVATNSILNVTSTNTLLTLTSVNASTLTGTTTSLLTGVIATSATLSGNNTFNDYTGENLTLAGNGLSSGDLNITGTLFLNENHSLTLNDSNVETLASTGSGNALLDGNLTITSLGSFSQNLTRLFPFTLKNETGSGVSASVINLYGINVTLWRVTNWAGDEYNFSWKGDENLTVYNSTWNETITMGSLSPTIYNYTGYALHNEVYNLTLDSENLLLNLTRASDSATWSLALNRRDRILSGNATTDGAGRATLNMTVNNISFADEFILNSHNQNTSITLANATPMSYQIDATPPGITLNGTAMTIYATTFTWNATVTPDTARLHYSIANGSDEWTNGSLSNTTLNASSWRYERSYDGLYLPVGNWILNVTVFDRYGNARNSTFHLNSGAAIKAALSSSASQGATIGGSNIGFTFNVTTKGAGSVVKAFLNLTNGALSYNSGYARLSNASRNVSVSASGTYAGAGNISIPVITSWPSYVLLNLSKAGLYNDALTLSLEPYSGLSAGTYSGSYGFGVFG